MIERTQVSKDVVFTIKEIFSNIIKEEKPVYCQIIISGSGGVHYRVYHNQVRTSLPAYVTHVKFGNMLLDLSSYIFIEDFSVSDATSYLNTIDVIVEKWNTDVMKGSQIKDLFGNKAGNIISLYDHIHGYENSCYYKSCFDKKESINGERKYKFLWSDF